MNYIFRIGISNKRDKAILYSYKMLIKTCKLPNTLLWLITRCPIPRYTHTLGVALQAPLSWEPQFSPLQCDNGLLPTTHYCTYRWESTQEGKNSPESESLLVAPHAVSPQLGAGCPKPRCQASLPGLDRGHGVNGMNLTPSNQVVSATVSTQWSLPSLQIFILFDPDNDHLPL